MTQAIHTPQSKTFTPHNIASLNAVTKRYGNLLALDSVNLEVRAGEVLALLGPNGAGKTTAVSLLLGLIRPNQGSVQLFGHNPQDQTARERVGAMLQLSGVPQTLRVGELLHLFSSYYPNPLDLNQILEIANLTDLSNRLYGQLSGGQRQRVNFALAVLGNPDLLFLDEPTVGLDVESRRAFWTQIRTLAKSGKTILLTTHYLEEADALADRIVVIDKGKIIAEGTPAEIKARTAGRRISLVTKLSADEIRMIPGVSAVEPKGNTQQILTAKAEPVVVELFKLDPGLSDLEVSGAGLEEAFIALTQKN